MLTAFDAKGVLKYFYGELGFMVKFCVSDLQSNPFVGINVYTTQPEKGN